MVNLVLCQLMLPDKKVVVWEWCSLAEYWNKNFSDVKNAVAGMCGSFDISFCENSMIRSSKI